MAKDYRPNGITLMDALLIRPKQQVKSSHVRTKNGARSLDFGMDFEMKTDYVSWVLFSPSRDFRKFLKQTQKTAYFAALW